MIHRILTSPALLLLHLSFLLVIAGGVSTWHLAEKGSVKLEKGKTAEFFYTSDGGRQPLPVPVTLENFKIEYYPGGTVPRDYVSHLIAGESRMTVSVNKIAEIDGYRLCQSGYDSTGASVLSVNHDPWGITLTYAGYLIFTVAGLWVLFSPGYGFRRRLRALCLPIMLLSAPCASASVKGVSEEVADSLGHKSVVYQGRVVTFNTLARDVVNKIHGSHTYRGLSATRTLLSMRLYPEEWKHLPIFPVKDEALARALNIKGKYASLADLFDAEGRYRVESLLRTLPEKERRAVEELDERVGIVLMLYSGDLIVAASRGEDLPEWKATVENIYNSVPFTMLVFILLFCGAAACFLSQAGWRRGPLLAGTLLCCAFIMSVGSFILMWVLGGHIPLSNTFETLCFAVLVMEILLLVVGKREVLLWGMGMLFCGALALVARLQEVNPAVTPLMPVLHSPWLSLHVSLVMTSYSLFALTFASGVTALILPRDAERLQRISIILLYPAEWLLGLGIATGSVWANESWGEYWSWDPKETWALVTFIIYAVPLHPSVVWLRRPRRFHIYMLLALAAVAMTYFGVNFLDSLHAYN